MENSNNTGNLTKYKEILENAGIKPSFQRLKIFQFLYENRTHPTVDTIHSYLIKEIPTLSKTTIYSMIKLLVEKRLVKEIEFDEHEIRYDFISEKHAHLKCIECGKIFDVHLPWCKECENDEIEGHSILQCFPYFKGICRECRKWEGSESDQTG